MIEEKTKIIVKICKDKSVLDIGCVSHNSSAEMRKHWVHKNIQDVAKNLIGIDYLKNDVERLVKLGYNMKYANAENFDLKKKFDVIVAADLIEHLFNVGGFLESTKKHMNKDSVLIITTPNPFSIRRIIGSILFGRLKDNPEHTCFFSDTTITQLLKRKGYKNVKIQYLESNASGFTKFVEKFLYLFLRKENRSNLIIFAKI